MTERILGPEGSPRRMRWVLLMAVAAAAFAAFFVAGASGLLTGGSTFDSANGKLDPTTAAHDWNSPVEPISCVTPVANCGVDLVKDQTDNALGQGSKEDLTAVTVVAGSIPPSKDDLSRFYINHEKVNGIDFLYLAWERSNLLGSAHIDFELNKQSVGITSTTLGAVALNRTAGDKLIDFDFSGSGTPVLAVHTWILTGAAGGADCEANNTYPCWNKGTVLGASSAESAVNNSPVTDNNLPGPNTLAGNTKNGINSTFGEAGINMEAAGLFDSTTCTSFADAWVKSRSSGNSFGSELKDIIAPIPTKLSNCGTIVIKKQTTPRGVDHNFSFQNVDVPTGTGVTYSHSLDTNGQFTLNDVGNTGTGDSDGNTQTITGVLSATYHVKEIGPGTGFDLTGLTCDHGGGADANDSSEADIPVTVGETTTCTFTNTQRGTIVIKKVTVPSPDLTGKSFSFTPAGQIGTTAFGLKNGESTTYSNIKSTVAGGTSSSVAETVPTGWDLTSATCDNGNAVTAITVAPGGTTTCTFTNTARGTIVIKKVTVPSPDPTATSFSFTPGGAIGTTGFNLSDGGSKTYLNVQSGTSSSVAETVPAAWDLTSATCDNGNPVTAITVAAGGTTTCTFTNTLKFGALKITKQSIKSGHAGLAGAKFTITGPNSFSKSVTSGTDGTVCVDGLLSGDYNVTETDPPTGYTIDNINAVPVTVKPSGAKCTDTTFGGQPLTFNDTPKTDLLIKLTSQDSGSGGSNSTITCTKDVGGASIGNSPQGPTNPAEVDATGLSPGDYTCKVNIDP